MARGSAHHATIKLIMCKGSMGCPSQQQQASDRQLGLQWDSLSGAPEQSGRLLYNWCHAGAATAGRSSATCACFETVLGSTGLRLAGHPAQLLGAGHQADEPGLEAYHASRTGCGDSLSRAPRGAAAHQLRHLVSLAAAQHVHKGQSAGAGAVGCEHLRRVCNRGGGWGGGGIGGSQTKRNQLCGGGQPATAAVHTTAGRPAAQLQTARAAPTTKRASRTGSPQRLASDSTRSPPWHSAL